MTTIPTKRKSTKPSHHRHRRKLIPVTTQATRKKAAASATSTVPIPARFKKSSQETARLIRRFHVLNKELAKCRAAGDTAREIDICAEMQEMGGLDWYQKASTLGQSKQRGGDSSKWLVGVLEEKKIKEKYKDILPFRLLDVGALLPTNYAAYSSWIRATPIDLNPQHPEIRKQDFLKMAPPAGDGERFDVVCLSLVVNFVGDPVDRERAKERYSVAFYMPCSRQHEQRSSQWLPPSHTFNSSSTPPFSPPATHFPHFRRAQPTLSTWQNQSSLWASIILAYYRHHRLYRLELNETVGSGSELFENPRIKRECGVMRGKIGRGSECRVWWGHDEADRDEGIRKSYSLSLIFNTHCLHPGRLPLEALQVIIDDMVKQGTAEWDVAGATGRQLQKTQCFIYWRKPEEWANYISSWVSDNGMNNSILTLYEIANGDNTEGTGEISSHSSIPVSMLILPPRSLNATRSLLTASPLLYTHTELQGIDTSVLLKSLDVLVRRGVAQIFAGTSDPESVGVKFFGIS
ncbi:putative methyltransferase-domain-containing protein [Jimgerdemannia flammicorona]|uniref:Putative methyltransferase-domain-containing protein n=1 Tax=Jimgerdemannia flammicorona TaxID=994334 RepID=A0A433QSN0_9FUNG|nr:putative methyltransferase-domain-containing protein [Jimgerdemannia flammicorona]